MSIEIGAILDVYLEGEPTFRACVLSVTCSGSIWVVNLTTGNKHFVYKDQYEEPVIGNIFSL